MVKESDQKAQRSAETARRVSWRSPRPWVQLTMTWFAVIGMVSLADLLRRWFIIPLVWLMLLITWLYVDLRRRAHNDGSEARKDG